MAAKVHGDETWMLVGQNAKSSLIVRGGANPIAIQVSHTDSADLLNLIADANAGVASRRILEYRVATIRARGG